MNIRFLAPVSIELIEELDDEGNIKASSMEDFQLNEVLKDVDIVDDSDEGRTQFQTGDGSVFFLDDEAFEEVED